MVQLSKNQLEKLKSEALKHIIDKFGEDSVKYDKVDGYLSVRNVNMNLNSLIESYASSEDFNADDDDKFSNLMTEINLLIIECSSITLDAINDS